MPSPTWAVPFASSSARSRSRPAALLGLDALEALRSDIDRTAFNPLGPQARLGALRGELDAAVRDALAGDVGAAGDVSELARVALELTREVHASGPLAQETIRAIREQLDQVIEAQERRASTLGVDVAGQIQLSADEQIAAIREQTRALIEALADIRRALPAGAV